MEVPELMSKSGEELEEELEYLKFYVEEVFEFLGPCDSDVHNLINERWLEYIDKDKLPKGYN